MELRRPRSVAIPLALTGLVLLALVYRLARFDERIVIRITSPPGPHPLRLKAGSTVPVEGTVDDGDATYRVPEGVSLDVVARDAKHGKISYGSWHGNYDRGSKTFSGTITVPRNASRPELYLGADVFDRAGRHHGGDLDAPDGSLIPIVIEK